MRRTRDTASRAPYSNKCSIYTLARHEWEAGDDRHWYRGPAARVACVELEGIELSSYTVPRAALRCSRTIAAPPYSPPPFSPRVPGAVHVVDSVAIASRRAGRAPPVVQHSRFARRLSLNRNDRGELDASLTRASARSRTVSSGSASATYGRYSSSTMWAHRTLITYSSYAAMLRSVAGGWSMGRPYRHGSATT